jgi:hypothetical protein
MSWKLLFSSTVCGAEGGCPSFAACDKAGGDGGLGADEAGGGDWVLDTALVYGVKAHNPIVTLCRVNPTKLGLAKRPVCDLSNLPYVVGLVCLTEA